ncbi:DUF692 domain-containing protein [Hoeflea prorocentri]|uniref:UPF0276 protein OQ273_00535 n=1 Tax=Hoeflea prorocentri TaxID=1922333 RepID=A0A9X3ZFI7_9HYPH|nr:DUF692 domain-containing protein [Hoeflea prorocentri]MCY6379243.1 DUF692 domain-containing protein [Hoeflea prorocentri]MDA5397044.1 DUF692 domain-containing protein [Hoeflea prorocentri]
MTQSPAWKDGDSRARFTHKTVPARAGAGLKSNHIDQILRDDYRIGFLEVHAENYMGEGGAPHRALTAIRQSFPLSVHGVGLSIGSEHGLDADHIARLKAVVDRYEPGLVSEHLAWSTHDNSYYNDLLPVPYDRTTLNRVCDHIDQVQEALGRKILLENPSTYVQFEQSSMSETDFICEIAKRTGCGLLLDINNVFVSATNHKYRPLTYLSEFPLEKVEEIHLAGHAGDTDDEGELLLIDAHDRPVDDEVWKLYDIVIGQMGPVPTLIEWDNDVPEWPVLKREAMRADEILERRASSYMLGSRHAAAG